MENLVILDMALHLPDSDGFVKIRTSRNGTIADRYVPFTQLEKWVASIREQIITSSNEQAECVHYDNCTKIKIGLDCIDCDEFKPPVG